MIGGTEVAFDLGAPEIVIIILVIVILFFGAKKIPELAKGLGRAMGEFKRGRSEVEREMQQSAASDAEKAARGTSKPAAAGGDKDAKASGIEEDSPTVRAAKALGIETEGKTEEQLKEEIAKAIAKGQ